jgi:hypothetical protein
MPLYRRIATRGFSNARFKKVYTIVKLGSLDVFEDGSKVTKEELLREKIIRKKTYPVKILAGGTLTKKLTVEIDKMSKKAQDMIISLGGKVIVKEKTAVKVRDKNVDTGKTKEKPKGEAGKKGKLKKEDKTKEKTEGKDNVKEKVKKTREEKEKIKEEKKSEDKEKDMGKDKEKDKEKEKAGEDG